MPYQHSVIYPAGTTGAQPSINLDPSIAPFDASLAVILGAGASASYELQYTLDNFDSPLMTDAKANWLLASGITSTTTTTTIGGSLSAPVTRVRVNFSVAVAGGTVTFDAVQGLSTN